jgi:siderophore synthetase component
MGRDAALWRNLLHLAPYSAEAGTIRRLTPEELGAAVDASQFNREDADMEASARHAAQLNEQLAQQFTLKDPSSASKKYACKHCFQVLGQNSTRAKVHVGLCKHCPLPLRAACAAEAHAVPTRVTLGLTISNAA